MLNEEVEKYMKLTGNKEAWENTSVSRIGGYLDGYEKGLEVLDKIRAEIKTKYDSIPWRNTDYEDGWIEALEWVFDEVIDKYRTESEGT